MTLRLRMSILRDAFWPAIIGVMLVVTWAGLAIVRDPGLGLFFVVVWAAVAFAFSWRSIARRLAQRVVRAHQERIDDAISEGDDETRRELVEEADEYYRRFFRNAERQRARLRASALSAEARWSEALAVVDAIDRGTVPAGERAAHDNAVAWCCAHAGATARAVEIARANAEAHADASLRPYLLGTLGIALVLDGQHAAALAPLRDALALGGPRWAQAVRHLHLGDALAALGRFDEARAEWHKSVTAAPKNRWGRRAQERLSAAPPAAYR